MKIPRILLAAGSSGSGKTLITCGLLEALVERGLKTTSFKCGPDYIDPMFHSRVIGTKSRNLDTFFTGSEVTKYLLTRNARDCEIAVMEGVMGFYDGVAGTTTTGSAYDLAKVTDTPVILIVNSRGMSVSLAAYVKGFLEYKKDSHIKGVIFNQMSPMLYPRMKKLLEEELVSYIGSDCHGSKHRVTRIGDAYAYVTKKMGRQMADEIFIDNPQEILDNAKHCMAAAHR